MAPPGEAQDPETDEESEGALEEQNQPLLPVGGVPVAPPALNPNPLAANIAIPPGGQPILNPPPGPAAQPILPPAPGPVAAAIMAEKATSTIPIEKFKSGKDDFDEWVTLFEQAVLLATNAPAARHAALFLAWLPLSLDSSAKDVFRQVPANSSYAEAKALLKTLLVDPCEEYKWQLWKSNITWDQKESFHSLATRVKRSVDKYEKHLDAEGKKRSYFIRFRESLPKPFKDAIDLALALEKDDRTIEMAIRLASSVQLTRSDTEVTFAAAAMTENRVHGLELQVAELGTKIDNLCLKNDKKDDRKDRGKERGSGRDGRYDRNPSPRWVTSSSDGSRSASRDRDRDRGRRDGNRRDRDRRDRDRKDRDRRGGRDKDNRDKRGSDRNSGRDKGKSGRDRDNRRSSPSTSGDRGTDHERDRNRRGKDDNRKSDKSEHRSLKTEDESSSDEVDPAVLNACIEALQKQKSEQKGKRSKARGNE